MSEMLIALRDGSVIEDNGELFEIFAGKTRVSPDMLDREPQLADFFDHDYSVRGSDAERAVVRTMLPSGRVVADDRWPD